MFHIWKQMKKLESAGVPSPEFRHALLARLSVSGVQLRVTSYELPRWHVRIPRLATALAVLVLIFAGTGAYAYESPNVTAGHPLYIIKKKMESARMRMARSPEDRARVHLWKMERRLREAELTAAENEFKSSLDVIRSLPPGERGQAVRNVLIRPDAAHIQDLAGLALRDQRKLERVQKLLDDEQKYLEKNLDAGQDPVADRIMQKHLRVREALQDAIQTVQIEDVGLDE